MQTSVGANKEDIFQAVDASLQEEDARLRCHFNKAAACMNDLFMTMSNYDVRFHFDPMSLDDCRCEIMSSNEVNLLCILKEVPFDSCVLNGKVTSGAVMIELEENYTTRLNMASWDDVITEEPSGRRFLSTKKLLATLQEVMLRSIHEINQERNRPKIFCNSSEDQISVVVNLGLSSQFRLNILPAIQVDRHDSPLCAFDKKFREVFKSLHLKDTTVDSICLVAKPYCTDQDLLWRITFNDVENRIFNSKHFLCARHCLFILDKMCAKSSPLWGSSGYLLPYHLQAILIGEFRLHPRSKNWAPEKFYSRMKGVLRSFCTSLYEKKSTNIFTGVNVYSHFDAETLKVLAKRLSKCELNTKLIITLLQRE